MSNQALLGILFAAGQGTRLRPLTETLPKPLAEVNGITLLEKNMHQLVPFVDRFVIVVNWLGDMIIQKIGPTFEGKQVDYVWQKNSKGGTLDALRSAVYSSLDNQKANYLVMNSDDIFGPDIFNQIHKSIQTDPELALVSATIVEDQERLKNFGVYEVDTQNHFISVVEHPVEYVSNLVNTGVYYFPNKVLEFITKEPNLGQKEDLITNHLFNPYAKKYPILVVGTEDLWFAVSNLQDLDKARELGL